MKPTKRLYWEDDHMLTADGVVLDVRERRVALDQTCSYGGGGGQPPDHGTLSVETMTVKVGDVKTDTDCVLWHCCESADPGWMGESASIRRYFCIDLRLDVSAQRSRKPFPLKVNSSVFHIDLCTRDPRTISRDHQPILSRFQKPYKSRAAKCFTLNHRNDQIRLSLKHQF